MIDANSRMGEEGNWWTGQLERDRRRAKVRTVVKGVALLALVFAVILGALLMGGVS